MRRQVLLFLSVALLGVSLAYGAGQAGDEIPRLAKILGWKAGDVIADVGAGEGQYAFAAHQYVGPTGKVYATELGQKKLAALKSEAAHRGWKNFGVLEAAEKETNLPAACCDAILLRRRWTRASTNP
jgi:ubiquinone/menaquinone biosynthesis C-methylase UbiE